MLTLLITIATLVGFLAYLFIASVLILSSKKYYPIAQLFEEIKISFMSFLIGTPTVIMIKYYFLPFTQVYYQLNQFNTFYFLFNSVLYFILFDFFSYLLHLFLHNHILFNYIHSLHHKFKEPSPFAAVAIHPLEFILNVIVPNFIVSSFYPVHFYIWSLIYIFHLIWSIIIHDGFKIQGNNIITGSKHHLLHHKYYNCNYSFIFDWDKLFNTYKKKTKK